MTDNPPVTMVEKHSVTYSGICRVVDSETGTIYKTLEPSQGIDFTVHVPKFDIDDNPERRLVQVHIKEVAYRSTMTLSQMKQIRVPQSTD